MSLEFESIRWSVVNGVGHIVLNRPDSDNRLDTTLRAELLQALIGASEDDNVHVIVIRGEKRSFSSGLDPRELQLLEDEGAGFERVRPLLDEGRRLVTMLKELGKPVVAVLNGTAIGAGAALALACDIRIASEDASISFDACRRDSFPDWGTTYFLPRLVGSGRALDLLWTGRSVEAAEAERLGIVQHTLPSANLDDGVQRYAERLAAHSRTATRLTGMAIESSTTFDLSAMLDLENEAMQQCWQTRRSKTKH